MEKILRFKGLCCANCAAKIERKLQKIKGANEIILSFSAAKLFIDAPENDMERIINDIQEISKKIEPEMKYYE